MSHLDAWAILGIEPTDDERTIRVAYSVKLKAFDPDSDPQTFVALRDARDRALYLARGATREAQAANQPQQQRGSGPVAELEAIPQAQRHARDLQAMFYAGRDPARPNATQAERQAMVEHWEGIVADPRLHELGFFSELEHWTIGLIVHHLPLSDPLIVPATELFGWTASDDLVTQSRDVALITSRYGWLSYIDEVQDPDHPWHPLWQELIKPGGPGAKRARLGPARVRALLHAVRSMRPDLEDRFDPARVALWEPQPEPAFDVEAFEFAQRAARNRKIKAGVVCAILAVVILSFISGRDDAPQQTESPQTFAARMRAEEQDYNQTKYLESLKTENTSQ